MFNFLKKRTASFWLFVLFVLSFVWDNFGKPIVGINVENWAASKGIDNELVDGGRELMPVIDAILYYLLSALNIVTSALSSHLFIGFVIGALVFSFWDSLLNLSFLKFWSREKRQSIRAFAEDLHDELARGVHQRNQTMKIGNSLNVDDVYKVERQKLIDWSKEVENLLRNDAISVSERSRFSIIKDLPELAATPGKQLDVMWNVKLDRLRDIIDRIGS